MTIALTRVKDIGPVAADVLANHGINSVAALASLSPAQLGKVPGFGPLRSQRVIAAAKSLLATAESAGIDLGQKAGTVKSRSSELVAGQKGKGKNKGKEKEKDKGKGSRKKRKGKSGSAAGDAGKKSGKGKGGKNKGKGDKKKPGRKKDARKRDNKKKGKKKK